MTMVCPITLSDRTKPIQQMKTKFPIRTVIVATFLSVSLTGGTIAGLFGIPVFMQHVNMIDRIQLDS